MFFKAKKEDYYLASAFTATLTENNGPLSGVNVSRTVSWNGDDPKDVQHATTDANGLFSFPAIVRELAISPLAQFAANVHIEAHIGGEKHTLWYNSKLEAEENKEFGGEPLERVVCDLKSEEVALDLGFSRVLTICRWVNMPTDWD
ncbi:hypothetical protein L1F30_03580 [Simiduia sp. 21SJ11W-1]|uniref:DUF6795 domain-containing protein n=1 Tax=Simiduia sp. 21SJ11W-1 TaxID=2909669 RepID=UPI0020A0B723|nr:DUF6795 domain-containing protein [Simiduia sp. 21SJ11W-1]UTA48630.1 hypothetical protein L1F30_03580 [Simiduia sp. 21SJ11W-1]